MPSRMAVETTSTLLFSMNHDGQQASAGLRRFQPAQPLTDFSLSRGIRITGQLMRVNAQSCASVGIPLNKHAFRSSIC